jgi:hypothetical protein
LREQIHATVIRRPPDATQGRLQGLRLENNQTTASGRPLLGVACRRQLGKELVT